MGSSLPPPVAPSSVPTGVVTSASQSIQMGALSVLPFANLQGLPAQQIIVDPSDRYQAFMGVGAALTDSTCWCLTNYMSATQRQAFLQQTFGTNGFSTARICMGTSDFNARAQNAYYTYCDTPGDYSLSTFSIGLDVEYIIPILQQALAINPRLKFIASPWSPPAWLKTNNALYNTIGQPGPQYAYFNGPAVGGTTQNLTTYANYFVMFIQAYASYGIPIWAINIQNEATLTSEAEYPHCLWNTTDYNNFISSYLGPALDAAGLDTKILVADDSWGSSILGQEALASSAANPYIYGMAYHNYGGTPEQQLLDMRPYPSKTIHTTEISTFNPAVISSTPGGSLLSVSDDQAFMAGVVAIQAIRNGSNSLTLWNLLLDPNGNPYNPQCSSEGIRGCAAVSNDGLGTVSYNPEYMMLAHIGQYVKPGAVRIRSTNYGTTVNNGTSVSSTDLQSVAFVNKDNSVVAFIFNGASVAKTFPVTDAATGLSTLITLNPRDMATLTWIGSNSQVQGGGSFTAPGAPTSLAAAASGTGRVSLSWAAPASVGSGLGGYVIKRGSASGAETLIVGAALATATSFVDNDTVAGTTYWYTVQSIGPGGLSAISNQVSINCPAAAPASVALTASSGNGVVSLSMSGAARGAAITSFSILRGTTPGGESATPIATVNVSNGSQYGTTTAVYSDSSGIVGTIYYYQAVANTTAGDVTSNESSAAPGSALNHYLSASAGSTGAASAPSTAANDNSTGVLDIEIWVNLSNYTPASNLQLIGKAIGPSTAIMTATNSEWSFALGSNGALGMRWVSSGSTVFAAFCYSTGTTPAPLPSAALGSTRGVWLRAVTVARSTSYTDGLGVTYAAETCTFLWALDNGLGQPGTWNVVGSAQSFASTTGFIALGASGPPLTILQATAAYPTIAGDCYKAIVKNGSGAVLFNPDFTAQSTGATSFADTAATPNTYTITAPFAQA